MNGWDDVKTRYSDSQFNRNVKALVDIGIPKALLQNLWEAKGTTIPVAELIKMDFSKQYPDGYKPPISTHIKDFKQYTKPKLTLVA